MIHTIIPLKEIVEVIGIRDAVWALKALADFPGRRNFVVEFAIECAESVLQVFEENYPDDKRPRRALELARRSLTEEVSKESLEAAANAAADIGLATYFSSCATSHAAYAASHAAYAAYAADAASHATYAASHAGYAAYADNTAAAVAESDKQREILLALIDKYEGHRQ